jgi:hypothetical protein
LQKLAGKLVKDELLSEISHLTVSRDFNNIIYGVYLSDPLPWPSGANRIFRQKYTRGYVEVKDFINFKGRFI